MATNKWRTSEDVRAQHGLIGPNAILQMLPVLDQVLGPTRRKEIVAACGLRSIPDGTHMIPEADAARLHAQVRREAPRLAAFLSQLAGTATARYILRNRIPRPAQMLLKVLPAGVSAKLLSQAIEKHAWTFAGSGQFHVVDPMTFEIIDNPLIKGETANHALCHWHRAVFARLYSELVAPGMACEEVSCAAQGGRRCLFQLHPRPPAVIAGQNMTQIKAGLSEAQ